MIYCVEDDNSIRELVVYTLNSTGYKGKGFANADEFWESMKEELPEMIILDIMLPGEDGISILKKLKSSPVTEQIPVMMATAKDSEIDKVVGLDLGADDYLAKPFGMMEMVSRVKAILRRMGPQIRADVVKMGNTVIDANKHKVTVDGRKIVLTRKEFDLLLLFAENPERVFTREQLLAGVWHSDTYVETRTVDVHVGTLRTKLGKDGDLIKTVRGIGYRMEAGDA